VTLGESDPKKNSRGDATRWPTTMISAAEVEEALLGHEGTAECAEVGVPSDQSEGEAMGFRYRQREQRPASRTISALPKTTGSPLGRKAVKAARTNTQALGLTYWKAAACPSRSGWATFARPEAAGEDLAVVGQDLIGHPMGAHRHR